MKFEAKMILSAAITLAVIAYPVARVVGFASDMIRL
jgi:hypothetical protein